jgi:hypothetical protein
VSKFLKDLVTGTSNLDYELSRVLWLLGGLTYLGMGVAHLVINGVFVPLEFGGGFGALMVGGGFGTAAKDRAKAASSVADAGAVEGGA